MKKSTLTILLTLIMLLAAGCSNAKKETIDTTADDQQISVEKEAEEENGIKEINTGESIEPVEVEILTGTDFYALEPVPVGTYSVPGKDISIQVTEYESGRDGSINLEALVGSQEESIRLDNARLVKSDGQWFLYGDTIFRALDRINLSSKGSLIKEESVCWSDFPSPEVKKPNGEYNTHDIGTLGETESEDGWHYAVYVEGEEKAGIDVEKQLFFRLDEGIAVDEDGKVYMLYYSSAPWKIQIHEVDMPEPADLNGYWWVDSTFCDDDRCGFAGVTGESGTEYIIKTAELEALKRNSLENLEKYPEPLSIEPTFEVIEASPENFDKFRVSFGSDAVDFLVDMEMVYDDEYAYTDVYHLKDEVEKHWLGLIIQEEELEQVWYKDYTSFAEVKKAVKELNKFLDEWESNHSEEIINFFKKNPFWLESYPAAEEAYGISLNENGELVILSE